MSGETGWVLVCFDTDLVLVRREISGVHGWLDVVWCVYMFVDYSWCGYSSSCEGWLRDKFGTHTDERGQ